MTNFKNILIIEDNPEMRENTSELLELSGYKVLTAENGRIGVELAKKEKPNLIICDVMMPELDGFGVLHILSKIPDTASIPFIFLTAKTEREDMRKGMNMGADDYLTKPFEEHELLDAIETRLKKAELFKKEFSPDLNGLNQFISEARGLEELDRLCEENEIRNYRKKDLIYRESAYPRFVFFIHSGRVKTHITNEDGKEFITGIYGPGDFFGYTDLMNQSTYLESATMLEDGEIVLIPKDDFQKILSSNRDVAHQFIRMLSKNIWEKEEQLLRMAYNSVRKRVADALVELYKRYQNDNSATQPTIVISREDLARLVGTAKETLIRTLSDFKDEGLIASTGKNIQVTNLDGLINMRN